MQQVVLVPVVKLSLMIILNDQFPNYSAGDATFGPQFVYVAA